MIIDLHFHTKEYSACSHITMEEGIKKAKEIGLDGVCITDHEAFCSREKAKVLQDKYDILIIVGVEILTYEGDILCFGLKELPDRKLHAQELINLVQSLNGVCIAAHPFRNNNRGLGEKIRELKGLHAVEIWNGNTDIDNNLRAQVLTKELGLVQVGGSDAHHLEKIGVYATKFSKSITNEQDLINEIRQGCITPWIK